MNMNRIQVCLWFCSFSRRFTKTLSCVRLQAEHPKVNMLFQSLLCLGPGPELCVAVSYQSSQSPGLIWASLHIAPSLAVTSGPGCLDQTHPPSSQGPLASHACQLSISLSRQASNINHITSHAGGRSELWIQTQRVHRLWKP